VGATALINLERDPAVFVHDTVPIKTGLMLCPAEKDRSAFGYPECDPAVFISDSEFVVCPTFYRVEFVAVFSDLTWEMPIRVLNLLGVGVDLGRHRMINPFR
jgi:hypothetical protein